MRPLRAPRSLRLALVSLASLGSLSSLLAARLGGQTPTLPAAADSRTPYPTRRTVFYRTDDSTRRSGPRFGLIFLGGRIPDTAAVLAQRHVGTVVSLFGWDFQHQLGRNPGEPQPITDFVVGLGGLEQGLALPTVSTVIGLRMPNDFEFG